MSPWKWSPTRTGPYFGRKDICLHIERTVKALFPRRTSRSTSRSSQSPSSFYTAPTHLPALSQTTLVNDGGQVYDPVLPPIDEWIGYMLLRTALPNPTIFHALHLLRRLAFSSSSNPLPPALFSISRPSGHYALVLIAFLLATTYNMDDSYSLRSWCIASQNIFPLKEVRKMQLEMLRLLDWRMKADGEDLGRIIREDEDDFNEEMMRTRDLEMEVQTRRGNVVEKERLQLSRTRSLGMRIGTFLNVRGPSPSPSSPPPSSSTTFTQTTSSQFQRPVSRRSSKRERFSSFFSREKTKGHDFEFGGTESRGEVLC